MPRPQAWRPHRSSPEALSEVRLRRHSSPKRTVGRSRFHPVSAWPRRPLPAEWRSPASSTYLHSRSPARSTPVKPRRTQPIPAIARRSPVLAAELVRARPPRAQWRSPPPERVAPAHSARLPFRAAALPVSRPRAPLRSPVGRRVSLHPGEPKRRWSSPAASPATSPGEAAATPQYDRRRDRRCDDRPTVSSHCTGEPAGAAFHRPVAMRGDRLLRRGAGGASGGGQEVVIDGRSSLGAYQDRAGARRR